MLKPIKEEETKARRVNRKRQESEATHQERESEIHINFRFQGTTYTINARLGESWAKARDRFLHQARITNKVAKDLLYAFGQMDLDTVIGPKTLRKLGFTDGAIVVVTVRGLGGARFSTIKHHLKPEEAKQQLKDRLTDFLPKVETVNDQKVPSEVKELVRRMTQSMDEVQLMRARLGDGFLGVCLRQISEDTLYFIKDNIKKDDGGRKKYSEERLIPLMCSLYPPITEVGEGIKALKNMQGMMTTAIMHSFLDAYHFDKGGKLVYDVSKFSQDLAHEATRRQALAGIPSEALHQAESPSVCSVC